MKTNRLILLVALLFAGCATTQVAPTQTTLPGTSEYVYYTDALVNEMWFVLQEHPDQLALVRANVGEVLSAPCWKPFNKTLDLFAKTAGLRAELQRQAIILTLKKL